MINLLASVLLWLTGLYLISLALVMLLAPARTKRFLDGFASSTFIHYLEFGLRLIAGMAILLYAADVVFQLPCHLWVDSRGEHRRSFRSSLAGASALCAVGFSLSNPKLEAGRRCFIHFRRIPHSIPYPWRHSLIERCCFVIGTSKDFKWNHV